MSPEIILDITEEEYEKEGSKFITFPPNAKVGDLEYRDIEIGMVDWDTPGSSMKVPVTVTEEGPDRGKEAKISFGVRPGGIWKGKEIYLAITGTNMPMKQGSDGKMHPYIDPMELVGKPAVGLWQWESGHAGGDESKPIVYYAKLNALMPAGSKPKAEDLGI